MKRLTLTGAALLLLLALFWWQPLFHVVPLKATRKLAAVGTFNASAFVETFWRESLSKSLDQATDAKALQAAIRADAAAARAKYGRTLGLSSKYYYFLAGTGRVVATNLNSLSLSLSTNETADIIIETGNIFGNAVRDGTGLLNVSDFPNSRDFNDISSAINQRIETTVLPKLRGKAAVGTTVKFVGCAEITDEAADLSPLRVIPVVTEIQ